MKIYILPNATSMENNTNCLNKIKSENILLGNTPFVQACSDGIYECDEKGNNKRHATKTFIVDNTTGYESIEKITAKNKSTCKEIPDYISIDGKIEYVIHPDSKITQADIDETNKTLSEFGYGFTIGFAFNKKPCSIIVMQEGKSITDKQQTMLIAELTRVSN